MQRNKVPVMQVAVVNLCEVNRNKREKLKDIAKEFGCEIVQVYDRAWFANQFREHPDWRRKILQIEGGAFSFSRQPHGARSLEQQLSTVGRDSLIDKVNDTVGDVLLYGLPGVGKSHVASKLDGALFLERQTTPERLLDDLIETKPRRVVVDDAGARITDIDLLVRLRNAEKLDYRIIATCWPHEVAGVSDQFLGASLIEVELLTREELGSMLRELGITRPSVIVHILEQAAGRPAWALNLADLLIHKSDWKSVWTGRALREKIFTFMRLSNASVDAIDVLGTIALLDGSMMTNCGVLRSSFRFDYPNCFASSVPWLLGADRCTGTRDFQQSDRADGVRPHISCAAARYCSEPSRRDLFL